MAEAIDYIYRYEAESALALEPGSPCARLGLATSGGASSNPRLFSGEIRDPLLFADALLAIAAIARARFHVPPAMLEHILALTDPVVTASEERLRFEAFSSCCSVYGRLDMLPGSVDGELIGAGTTNVDVGPALRAALASVPAGAEMRLDVGMKSVEVSVQDAAVAERKVALPRRWLRGFLEVQAIEADMTCRFDVDGSAARRFLRDLPRAATRPIFVRAAGRELVIGHRESPGDVVVRSPERLRLLERLAGRASRLRVWASADGSSAWCLDLPLSRLTLVLSPEAWRGFSGEGRSLEGLASGIAMPLVNRLRADLAWQSSLPVEELARKHDAEPAAVRSALAALASSGMVGFDLADGVYFHRVLPFSIERVEREAPRLRRARALVAAGAVTFEPEDGPEQVAWVRGRSAEYRVRLGPAGQACTCPWWGKHQGERGPCAHVMAARMAREALEEAHVDA